MTEEPDRPSDVDVAAIFARLRAEVHAREPADVPALDGGPASAPLRVRGEAERLWVVTAEREIPRRPGPIGAIGFQVKRVVRKLTRWYVEPAMADQRQFNVTVLALVDELSARVAELERRRESAPSEDG